MSHFKKATLFAGEARGPRPTQPDEPVEFDEPGKLEKMTQLGGPLGEYAKRLQLEQTRRASSARNKGAKPPAIGNNYVEPVDFYDPGNLHTMARHDGPLGTYTNRLLSEHMAQTRIASSARNKGAKPP